MDPKLKTRGSRARKTTKKEVDSKHQVPAVFHASDATATVSIAVTDPQDGGLLFFFPFCLPNVDKSFFARCF